VEDAGGDAAKNVKSLEAKITALEAQIKKKDFSSYRQSWESTEAYAEDGLRLLTNKELCLKCHSVGKLEAEGAQGPNLMLSAERLRPGWTEQWISNPRRLFTYSPVMPQNFPNEPDSLKWGYQQLFVGSPIQQARATRDVLMDLPRLADHFGNRPNSPTGAGGGK
jgi:hypothetical protein